MYSNTAKQDFMENRDVFNEQEYRLSNKARTWNELSQTHINLAHLLKDEGLTRLSLILAHMAVRTKLKQIYVQAEGTLPPGNIFYDDLVSRAREFAAINLETELFLNTLNYISEPENVSFLQHIDVKHVEMMLERIDHVLNGLDLHGSSLVKV